MKKHKKIALYALTALILTITCAIGVSATFTDVKNSPYKEAIEALAELKITVGKSSSEFGVNENVTRQQMTLFAARLLTGNEINGFEKAKNDTTFTDITDSTYFKSISYCYNNNIIVGRNDTAFDPLGNVSVQEAITIMVRALGYNGLPYPDGYIETAKDFGLLKNLDNVTYTAPMTRGQVAQLLYNTFHNINLSCEYGKSLYDVKFAKTAKLGYFEITTLAELKANYKYLSAKYNLRNGYDSYIIEDVVFMGYTGDIQYYFPKDSSAPCNYMIDYRFSIMGEVKCSSPVDNYIENPSNALTAAEAKDLLETMNFRLACFVERPVASYQTGTIKAGAPADIYKATVDGYTSLSVYYQEKADGQWLSTEWALKTHTEASSIGCRLYGTICYTG